MRRLLRVRSVGAALGAVLLAVGGALAQSYPTKPIRRPRKPYANSSTSRKESPVN